MSEQGHALRVGQRVWHKGPPAVFLYYARDDAAIVRFEGRSSSTVVSTESLSAAPPDETEESAA